MKRYIFSAVAMTVAMGAASTAWAGQEPYVGVVGVDDQMNTYYLEQKLWRWLHPEQTAGDEAWGGSSNLSNNEEVCIPPGPYPQTDVALAPNKALPVLNAGYYYWRINLPKKPRGNINIQIQCGVLKPNSYSVLGMPNAIDTCAGETGEQTSALCEREFIEPNTNVIHQNYLPTVTATAYNHLNNATFNLTAYRVPSAFSNIYELANGQKVGLRNSKNLQVLDGTKATRIVLKACQPENVFVKMPIAGQVNGNGQTEQDLEAGDEITLRLDFPRGHTMDVYCNQYSVKLMGLGDPSTEDDVQAGL
jgi:hypothetical protein